MEEFSFTWKIQNFNLCVNKTGGYVSSPTFIADSVDKTAWFLQLYPYGDGDETHVACYLNRSDTDESGQASIAINFTLSFVMADGSEELLRTFENQAFSLKHRVGCKDLKRRDDILKDNKIFLPKTTLSIRCYLQCCTTAPSASKGKGVVKSFVSYLFDEKPDASATNLPPEMYASADGLLKGVKAKLCPYPEHCTARTNVIVEKRTVVWRIENFRTLKKREKVSMPVLSPSRLTPSLLLTFYIDDESIADEHIQIEVRLKANTVTTGFVSFCKITVLNEKGKPCDFNSSTYFFEAQKKDQVWMFPPIIKKSKLISEETLYFKNDTLSLLCEFALSDGATLSQIEETVYSTTELYTPDESKESLINLRDDFSELRTEPKLYDVYLLVGKDKLPAHKAILSARSPVFKAMFEGDMTERESGIVKVEDFDLKTLTGMLTYMYGGMLEDLQCESSAKLYSAADKYQCLCLKEKCATFLKKNISVANVCDVLVLADMHQDEELKTSAHEFIFRHGGETLRSEEWKSFMKNKTELAVETLHYLGLAYMES